MYNFSFGQSRKQRLYTTFSDTMLGKNTLVLCWKTRLRAVKTMWAISQIWLIFNALKIKKKIITMYKLAPALHYTLFSTPSIIVVVWDWEHKEWNFLVKFSFFVKSLIVELFFYCKNSFIKCFTFEVVFMNLDRIRDSLLLRWKQRPPKLSWLLD